MDVRVIEGDKFWCGMVRRKLDGWTSSVHRLGTILLHFLSSRLEFFFWDGGMAMAFGRHGVLQGRQEGRHNIGSNRCPQKDRSLHKISGGRYRLLKIGFIVHRST